MATVYVKSVPQASWSRSAWDDTGGTNYVVGDRVYVVLADGSQYENLAKTFVCIADNNSTTDPETDTTNWARVGFSEEYPYHAPDGNICTATSSGEIYLEGQYTRYKNLSSADTSFYWNAQNFGADSEGTIIFLDGIYKSATILGQAKINYTAKNIGKVTININVNTAPAFGFHEGSYNIHEGIIYQLAGIHALFDGNTKSTFKSCTFTDRESIYGSYTCTAVSLSSYNAFTEFKNCLIDLPNAHFHLGGYSAGDGPNGRDAVWENSTFAINLGNVNQYEPLFLDMGNLTPLEIKKCIFYALSHVYSDAHNIASASAKFSESTVFLADDTLPEITSDNAGLLVRDPLFVDATNGDFRLRPSSPLIGGLKEDNAQKASLEREYPEGKWFDSYAAAGGDGSWETPYNNYAEAIDSFTGDEAVVLIKEGQHPLHSGYWNGSAWGYTIDLPKVYSGGIKFIGMGSGSIFDTSGNGISNYGAFWNNSTNNPNIRDTPFLFKDFDILMNNSVYINRGMICACRAEYINVNVTQALNLGAINSQLFDNSMASGSGSGEYLKMTGCTINVSHSANNIGTNYLVGNSNGLKQFQSCTFADLNRTTSTISSAPHSFVHYDFGSYPGSFIKDCAIYSKTTNTLHFGTSPTNSGAAYQGSLNLEIKNCTVYSTQGSIFIGSNYGDGIKELDPKFIATEPHDFDLRLRPNSSAIGGIKAEPTNVYYLQPGNPFNGDGSQKDASTMTTDGDSGPFNEFNKILAAGVPYGSTIIIVNGTYTWPAEINTRKNSTNWATYTYEGYNYIAETDHGVIFDANKQQKHFGYMPFGSGDDYLDLDTTFSGIQFNNVVGNVETTSRNQIFTASSSAGYGSCTFKSCKFLGWINTSGVYSYPWTGGTRSGFGSSMHWEGCEISIAFDNNNRLLGGGDGFADDTYHGAWSWKNCTFYIASGMTTFNGRNAANGTYVPISSIFGTSYNQSSRIFKNNIFYNGSGTATLGPSSADKLPTIQGNCFLGTSIETSYQQTINENQNLIDIDPLFVDASNDNFALRPLSPLIGQGI